MARKTRRKTALITGITGQDGSFLAEFLLEKGYRVVGLCRRSVTSTFHRLKKLGIFDEIEFADFELLEFSSICQILQKYQPDEFYNLAMRTDEDAKWEECANDFCADAVGVMNILDAIRQFSPKTRFFQESPREILKNPVPTAPFDCAKLTAHWFVCNYRENYGVFAVEGKITENGENAWLALQTETAK